MNIDLKEIFGIAFAKYDQPNLNAQKYTKLIFKPRSLHHMLILNEKKHRSLGTWIITTPVIEPKTFYSRCER